MRSHATAIKEEAARRIARFQYRKRYEVTCDPARQTTKQQLGWSFQYRKRYEVTCDLGASSEIADKIGRFNTASGMRSHATMGWRVGKTSLPSFNTASGMRSHATILMMRVGCVF